MHHRVRCHCEKERVLVADERQNNLHMVHFAIRQFELVVILHVEVASENQLAYHQSRYLRQNPKFRCVAPAKQYWQHQHC